MGHHVSLSIAHVITAFIDELVTKDGERDVKGGRTAFKKTSHNMRRIILSLFRFAVSCYDWFLWAVLVAKALHSLSPHTYLLSIK